MKRIRLYNVIGLITNLAIIALAAVSYVFIAKAVGDGKIPAEVNQFARFDVIASFVAIAAALFMCIGNVISIIKGETRIPPLFTGLYFTAAVMTCIALILNICFPKFNGLGDDFAKIFSIESGYLFFSFLIPVICIFNFLFISIDKKIHFGSTFVPFGGTIIYVVGVIIAIVITKNPGLTKYPFFHILPDWIQGDEKLTTNIIMLVVFILISYGLALVMWIVNRISHRVIFGSLIEEFEKDSKGHKEEKKGFVKYLKDSVAFKTTVQNKAGTTYHISYHNKKLKTWKVKGEDYERALKVFDTQKQAIDYAKALVAKNGGSIRIHSMVGKIRKD